MDEKRTIRITKYVEKLAEKQKHKKSIIDILKFKLNSLQQITKKRMILAFCFLLNKIRTYISNSNTMKNSMRIYSVPIISRCNCGKA